MARKGILRANISPEKGNKPPAPPQPAKTAPQGAVGALQSSLSKLQESAVQEIDPNLIDDAGVEDRLGVDAAAMRQLKESLSTYGQQVPVLLRPHAKNPKRYEIVYGRRRLKALKELGLPVKAMIRQLDDHALVMAQGQENTARQELSFIEKANFAAQLQAADYDRQTIADALSVDLPMLSRLLTVGTAFDVEFLRDIGSAPAIGRDRWMALVKLFKEKGAKSRAVGFTRRPEFVVLNTNKRFDAVFDRAADKPLPDAPKKPAATWVNGADGKPLVEVKRNRAALTLAIPTKSAQGFDAWLEENADSVITELHKRFTKNRTEEQ